jgi:hypothetical protein
MPSAASALGSVRISVYPLPPSTNSRHLTSICYAHTATQIRRCPGALQLLNHLQQQPANSSWCTQPAHHVPQPSMHGAQVTAQRPTSPMAPRVMTATYAPGGTSASTGCVWGGQSDYALMGPAPPPPAILVPVSGPWLGPIR